MVEYYYSILNLSLHKKRGDITDELVKKHYDEAMKRCKEQGIAFFKSEEYLKEYEEILKDAYRAVGSENARKHCDELIAIIEEYKQTRKLKKEKDKEPKSDLSKGKISTLKKSMQDMTKSLDTKEILKQIKEQAEKEYPITKPKEIER